MRGIALKLRLVILIVGILGTLSESTHAASCRGIARNVALSGVSDQEIEHEFKKPQNTFCYLNILPIYRNHPNFRRLAYDPARKGVTPQTIREAMAGIEAIRRGLIQKPIMRGPEEVEFYDGVGSPWDIKAPRSPRPGEKRKFEVKDVADSILWKLHSQVVNGITNRIEPVKIILDRTYMDDADRRALWIYLRAHASTADIERIFELHLEEPRHVSGTGPLQQYGPSRN